MKLNRDNFLAVIDSTPLVAINLIVSDPQGRILMGRRTNPPAQGSWFVPGGCLVYLRSRSGRSF